MYLFIYIDVFAFIPETLDNTLFCLDEAETLLLFLVIIIVVANLFIALTNH